MGSNPTLSANKDSKKHAEGWQVLTTSKWCDLPDSVKNYISEIINSKLAKKIVLFGSRARGDHRPNSDFDLAVEWINCVQDRDVLELKSELEVRPLTLHKIDLFDLNQADPKYLKEISSEGIVLWERKA